MSQAKSVAAGDLAETVVSAAVVDSATVEAVSVAIAVAVSVATISAEAVLTEDSAGTVFAEPVPEQEASIAASAALASTGASAAQASTEVSIAASVEIASAAVAS